MKTHRPTWIDIDLGALTYNLKQARKLISLETKILVTVKADAYGHGLIPVARHLARNKIDYLGVATIDEALVIKDAKIDIPILILGTIFPHQAGVVVKNDFIQTVFTHALAISLNEAARKQNKKVRVHIKIDTGMGRQGVWHNEALNFINRLKKLKSLKVEGVFTHFPCADSDVKLTRNQIHNFNKIIDGLVNLGINIPLRHCANSMAVISYKESHFNLVRPGLMLYGLYPRSGINITLKSVMALKSKIVFLKKVLKGTGISYEHSYHTPSDTTIGIVPIGYGDGYPRGLSNKSKVLIKGEYANVIGCICMDQLIVDVGRIKNVRIGDEVVLIGKQKDKKISGEELARLSHTIPYEIVCGFNSRIPRIYTGKK